MRGGELLDKMELVDPVYIEAADKIPPKQKRNMPSRWLAAAACFALIVGGAFSIFRTQNVQQIVPIPAVVTRAELPGVQKYLNYNGCRYVFLEGGAAFSLKPSQLGDMLGTLEYSIKSDPETYATADFAATYLVGGTVYCIKSYDPAFRLAVVLDGAYYLCENAGYLDGSALDAEAFFSAADFRHTVSSVEIYDHDGTVLLDTLDRSQAKKMVRLLSEIIPAQLSETEYEAIAQAQSSGESYRLLLRLKDTTACQMYVIPSLSIAMLGNGRYTLPENFHTTFDPLFSDLQTNSLNRK